MSHKCKFQGSWVRPLLTLVTAAMLANSAAAGMFDDMIDPQDGMLDLSAYLASARGFLPVPIIITEPAVGYGLGAAVAYFHAPQEIDHEIHDHQGPPSISVGFGGYTENDTYFFGGAHSGVWKEDHVRYLGVVAAINVNAKFYGLNSSPGRRNSPSSSGINFNTEGWLTLQSVGFRVRESDWWLGAEYTYADVDNTFSLFLDLPIEIPDVEFNTTTAGLGAFVKYDGRNTTFTPSSGTYAEFKYTDFGDTWGGDYDYELLEAKIYQYFAVGDYSSLGLRLEGDGVHGSAPFFAYPFVQLRGIPAMRYQGEQVLVGEVEYLWGLTPRWSVALFGGIGHTRTEDRAGSSDDTVGAGGVGFRYRLARKQGLQAGIDIARGPEETAFYITVGSAWH